MGEEKESLLRVHTYAELAHQRETCGHVFNQPKPEPGEEPIINLEISEKIFITGLTWFNFAFLHCGNGAKIFFY